MAASNVSTLHNTDIIFALYTTHVYLYTAEFGSIHLARVRVNATAE